MNEGIAYFIPRRTIGEFSQYVVIEETTTDEAQITEHPVQEGAAVTDHVFCKPSSVTIRGLSGPKFGPLTDTYERLRALWRARTPLDVVTGKAAYRNMVVKRVNATTDGFTENVLAFTVDLQEIIIVAVESVSVPASEKQANPAKTAPTQAGGKKQAGRYRSGAEKVQNADGSIVEVLDGPPDPVDSVITQQTGVVGADSPFDFAP